MTDKLNTTETLPATNCTRDDIYSLIKTVNPTAEITDQNTLDVVGDVLVASVNVPRWFKVSKDSVGEVFAGVPSIDTRNVSTRVLVENGETLVLGGIYEQVRGKEVERIPFFGSLPGVGWMFKTESKTDQKQELLIFVTPKIIKEGMAAALDY